MSVILVTEINLKMPIVRYEGRVSGMEKNIKEVAFPWPSGICLEYLLKTSSKNCLQFFLYQQIMDPTKNYFSQHIEVKNAFPYVRVK